MIDPNGFFALKKWLNQKIAVLTAHRLCKAAEAFDLFQMRMIDQRRYS